MDKNRYSHTALIDATTTLFDKAGLGLPVARTVAEILVEADLLGYDTHGLQFVPAYVAGVKSGQITAEVGTPRAIRMLSDRV